MAHYERWPPRNVTFMTGTLVRSENKRTYIKWKRTENRCEGCGKDAGTSGYPTGWFRCGMSNKYFKPDGKPWIANWCPDCEHLTAKL